MSEKDHKWHIDVAVSIPSPEIFVKGFESLVEKVGSAHKNELLNLITNAYQLAVSDCREHWKHYAGPINRSSLKRLYDAVKPNHNLIFY